MSISDAFQGEASTLLTQAGLVLFVLVFAAILWRLIWRMPRGESRALARMALDEAPVKRGADHKGGER